MIYEWKQARKILQIIKSGNHSQEFIQERLIDPLISFLDQEIDNKQDETQSIEDEIEKCFYESLRNNLESAKKPMDYHPGEIRMTYPPERGLELFLEGWEFITK